MASAKRLTPSAISKVLAGTMVLAIAVGPATGALAGGCKAKDGGLGVSRIIEVDSRNGPLYGAISKHTKEDDLLRRKEVILTFDDGPMPRVTQSILKTLDAFCTKATFFPVGKMAVAYPETIRDVFARGHTVGSHTWTHPLNLRRYSLEKAVDQIERGFSAIALAAGEPIAPFFRFPGLNDSDPMLAHLQKRGIATFTVDVVSNDSYISSSSRLASYTIAQLAERGRGIMLFHDIKPATARALPTILRYLKKNGYKVVHLRPKQPLKVWSKYDKVLGAKLGKAKGLVSERDEMAAMPSDGHTVVAHASGTADDALAVNDLHGVPVTKVAPPKRSRAATSRKAHNPTYASGSSAKTRRVYKKRPRVRVPQRRYRYRRPPPASSFWYY